MLPVGPEKNMSPKRTETRTLTTMTNDLAMLIRILIQRKRKTSDKIKMTSEATRKNMAEEIVTRKKIKNEMLRAHEMSIISPVENIKNIPKTIEKLAKKYPNMTKKTTKFMDEKKKGDEKSLLGNIIIMVR